MLLAGTLTERVVLMAPSAHRGPSGGAEHAYGPVAEVWACVRELTGREAYQAAALQLRAEVVAVIRWRPDVTEAWRLDWRGRVYHLSGPPVDPDGRRESLALKCALVQPAGGGV